MLTSYFGKSCKNVNAVSIALRSPWYFKGRVYKPLAPTRNMLNLYKNCCIDSKEYTELYKFLILDKLDPKKVYEELGESAVLLCWERPGEFCHRRIVADWFKIHLDIEVEELV